MKKSRNYNCRDVEMLMTSKTIAENFKANISELSAVRTDWSEQYANELIARIDSAIESHLGVDAKKELRSATAELASIQAPAYRDVSFLKAQLDEDFRHEPARIDEIHRTLGFNQFIKAVQKGNQESLIQLLYQFKSNLTDSLRDEILAKGISPVIIDRLIGYTDTLKQANVTQETLKGSSKEVTKDIADTFNAIYNEIIGICKKASSYFLNEPLKREQFSFSKVLSNLGARSQSSNSNVQQP